MVEQNRTGTYSQMAYSTAGEKLQIMSGQSYQKQFIQLVGGSQVVIPSTGTAYYAHPDWLGSTRLASTSSRTVAGDVAYAPFGEPYAASGSLFLSFTGMNQDTTANDYDFPAREYGIQGRWPSPDPAGIDAVDPADPQGSNCDWCGDSYTIQLNRITRITPGGWLNYYLWVKMLGALERGIYRDSQSNAIAPDPAFGACVANEVLRITPKNIGKEVGKQGIKQLLEKISPGLAKGMEEADPLITAADAANGMITCEKRMLR